jgi:PhnB protein
MKLTTYLNVPGTCAEALDFYVKHLGAKILMTGTFGAMAGMGGPQNLPPGLKPEHVLHARFQIGDTLVMASDGPPERVEPMRSAYLALSVDSNEEAERIYNAFFAHRFGQFRDKFGINWMVIHEKPMPRG